jgi:hypothetical protein
MLAAECGQPSEGSSRTWKQGACGHQGSAWQIALAPGADAVLDHCALDWTGEVRDANDGAPIDVIFELLHRCGAGGQQPAERYNRFPGLTPPVAASRGASLHAWPLVLAG